MFILINAALFLLYDNFRIFLSNTVLLGTGFASRIVIGFSPTIYASGNRTFSVMALCLIAVACCIYSNALEHGYINAKEAKIIKYIAAILSIFSMLGLFVSL